MFKSLIASIRIIECIVRSNETCKSKCAPFFLRENMVHIWQRVVDTPHFQRKCCGTKSAVCRTNYCA